MYCTNHIPLNWILCLESQSDKFLVTYEFIEYDHADYQIQKDRHSKMYTGDFFLQIDDYPDDNCLFLLALLYNSIFCNLLSFCTNIKLYAG